MEHMELLIFCTQDFYRQIHGVLKRVGVISCSLSLHLFSL